MPTAAGRNMPWQPNQQQADEHSVKSGKIVFVVVGECVVDRAYCRNIISMGAEAGDDGSRCGSENLLECFQQSM